jgi:hypothetical protein
LNPLSNRRLSRTARTRRQELTRNWRHVGGTLAYCVHTAIAMSVRILWGGHCSDQMATIKKRRCIVERGSLPRIADVPGIVMFGNAVNN